jgi:hypothetical protein
MIDMKKVILSVITIMMLITFVFAFTNNVQGDYNYISTIKTIDSKETVQGDTSKNSVQNVVGAVLKVTRVIATGVALIMLTVLAIKYMASAPNDRATIKQHAVVYIVGAIVLFASSAILGIIQNFAENNVKAS